MCFKIDTAHFFACKYFFVDKHDKQYMNFVQEIDFEEYPNTGQKTMHSCYSLAILLKLSNPSSQTREILGFEKLLDRTSHSPPTLSITTSSLCPKHTSQTFPFASHYRLVILFSSQNAVVG